MNAFGDAAEHVVLSAMPDQLGAREAIEPRGAGRLSRRRAAAGRHAAARRGYAAGALHAPLRSGAHLQLGRVRRGDGAAAVRRPAARPPRGRLQRGRGGDAEAPSATSTAGSACPARTGWWCRRSGSRGSRRRPGAQPPSGSCASPTASRSPRFARRPAGRDPGLRARPRRDRDRHRRRPARGQEPAAAGPRLRRHARQGRAAGDRRRGAGERGIAAEARAAGRRGAAADAGLPRRSGALDRPFRHFRLVVGQRAIPDLAGRGDGGRAAGGGDRGRRRRGDGLGGQPAADRRPERRSRRSPPRSTRSPTARSPPRDRPRQPREGRGAL